jgi:hypothetical protein
MAKRNLTDRTLKSLKAAKPGQRYDVRDGVVAGFIVRVTDKGSRSFMLQARFPGADQPARRLLGTYPELSLEKARAKATAWRSLIKAGVDPKITEEAERREALRKQQNTFSSVVAAFVAHCKRQGQRKAGEIERDLNAEFVSRWGTLPITSIMPADVREVINAKVDQGAEGVFAAFAQIHAIRLRTESIRIK